MNRAKLLFASRSQSSSNLFQASSLSSFYLVFSEYSTTNSNGVELDSFRENRRKSPN
ncbi:unnamed protein product [Cuscuta epithymum]|uniref:Uncharacterized protein n=1 Tax=Cuscuta epithymum TaxID=186058 RepID=A0AAV0G813_9ASTE|nr:unnamed protein product [Cuscuta epithymum]